MLHITAVADDAIFAGGVGPSERGNTVGDDTPYTLARFVGCRCRETNGAVGCKMQQLLAPWTSAALSSISRLTH